MNYTKSKNIYFAVPKNNVRDHIAIEVGDSKQIDFFPQVKVMRWDNESNISIRLIHDENNATGDFDTSKKTIRWEGKKIACKFYENTAPAEGGYEFEVILKEKPTTNKVKFTLIDKNVDYFYQGELTKEEVREGAYRPDNVIGSYAVYAANKPKNVTGGKEYRVGKIGHIYRPRIVDANGSEVWGNLKIDTVNKILTVEIPQKFLDEAVYPVRHAAGLTFGYTTAGATVLGATSSNSCIGNMVSQHTAATGDTVTQYSFYGSYIGTVGTPHCKMATYSVTSGNPDQRLATEVNLTFSVVYPNDVWTNTAAVSQAMSNGTTYCVATGNYSGVSAGNTAPNIWYDEGSAPGRIASTNTTLQQTFGATGTDSGRHYSFYATYTASSIKTIQDVAKASVKTINDLAIASVKTIQDLV